MSKSDNLPLTTSSLKKYLSSLLNETVEISKVYRLGESPEDSGDLKGFGYGFPYVIQYKLRNQIRKVVLETMRPGDFGHNHFSDRAQVIIWQHSAFNRLPKHVHSVDVGAFETDGNLNSIGKCSEFFILTEFIEGNLYHLDLDRLKDNDMLLKDDEERCLALSDYLYEIHSLKKDAPELYVRRIRDLVGHGECIMGLLDSYPKQFKEASQDYFINVEKDCVSWRWQLKQKTHRLCQVHGDFHPWNILFREKTDFTVLDRSRGEWGEPADDIAALTINYLFYSLQKHGSLQGNFQKLFNLFWKNYLIKSKDLEILNVIPPFYAWRAMVVASPIWYPNLQPEVRIKLFNFIENILHVKELDLDKINILFESP